MLALLLSVGLAHATGMAGVPGHDFGLDRPAPADDDILALGPMFDDAADAWGVPVQLLMALAWEASHWDPTVTTQWGGYGLYDFREAGEGPGVDIEDAAMLLDVSPDDIIDDPALQIEAAAAVLARTARIGNGGDLPAVDDLEAWWGAVTAMSGRHEEPLQYIHARYVYDVVRDGVERAGLVLEPTDLELGLLPSMPPPPASRCDYSGCYQWVSASSTNYTNMSRSASDITHVVIHTVQGSYSGCISWFQNPDADVSAHYVVRSSDGQITQMVAEEDKAWHVGEANGYSVGIEHEGWVDEPSTWYTDTMYAASADLTADIIARNGISASRSYIIAHSEAPGATHTDPGSGWDWDYYMELVSGGSGGSTTTGDIIGVVRDTDIYEGANLPGATVRIAETGETTTVASDGYYRFYDQPLGSYTMVASLSGYEDGSCTKSLSTGDNWCSIALLPDSGGGDGGAGDGGADGGTSTDGGAGDGGAGDGGSTDDTGDGGSAGPDDDPTPPGGGPPSSPPGAAVPLNDVQGGCSQAPAAGGLASLGLLLIGLVGRRRVSAR